MIRTRSINRQPPINISFSKAIFLFIFAFHVVRGRESPRPRLQIDPLGPGVLDPADRAGLDVQFEGGSTRRGHAHRFATMRRRSRLLNRDPGGRADHLCAQSGMGFWHGSSAIAINFDQLMAGPNSLSVKTEIEEVANGRERVKAGVIEGATAKDTPQRLMSTRLIHLPEWNPETYWIFMVRRSVFPFSPEPETFLPAGTDLRLELKAPLQLPAGFQSAAEEQDADDEGAIDADLQAKLLDLAEPQFDGLIQTFRPGESGFYRFAAASRGGLSSGGMDVWRFGVDLVRIAGDASDDLAQ